MKLEKELLRIKNYCHLIDIPISIIKNNDNYLININFNTIIIDLRMDNSKLEAVVNDKYGENIISGGKVSQSVITTIIENITNEG